MQRSQPSPANFTRLVAPGRDSNRRVSLSVNFFAGHDNSLARVERRLKGAPVCVFRTCRQRLKLLSGVWPSSATASCALPRVVEGSIATTATVKNRYLCMVVQWLPPHPDPLPQGEGTATPNSRKFPPRSIRQRPGDDSPSP